MPQIDYTYFQKRLTAIPNLNQDNVLADVQDYIVEYDNEYLVKVLGQELKDEYEAGLAVDPPENIEQRWLDLRDGVDFEYNGIKYKWRGFVRATKKSPIAYYVMWHYVRDKNATFTGVGLVRDKAENSENVSPNRRMVDIWNKMADDNRLLALYLYANRDLYPNYKLVNCGYNVFYPMSGYPFIGWHDYSYCYANNCDVLTTKANIYGI